MKTFVKLLAVLLLCAAAAALVLFFGFRYSLSAKDSADGASVYIIRVPSGASVRSAAEELEREGIVRSSSAMYAAARLGDYTLKAGRYRLSSDMDVQEILEIFDSGRQDFVKVSIPEGLTMGKIADVLDSARIVAKEDFLKAASDPVLLEKYRIPGKTAEGYLFPDTYFLTEDMNASAVVSIMIDTFFEKMTGIDSIIADSPEELYETVTLASIVEREYRDSAEAPVIASVFSNRLRYNIGLESCATVEYIITEIEGKPHPEVITYRDIASDNPYNTYKWAGLPPGPISNPGTVALSAAAHPAQTDYYYFRLVDPETGTHHFSKTLDEHADVGRQLYTKKAAGR